MKTHQTKRVGLVCVLFGIGALISGCPGLKVVPIPDDGLSAAIRAELGLPFGLLSQAELNRLYVLDARKLGIRDLTGIEYCQNLQSLNLDTNNISDITPLTTLLSLTSLNIENNDITDIEPLSGLYYLKYVWLGGNDIANLSALVANAENGGLGHDSYVRLTKTPLLDEDNELSSSAAEYINRLEERGVDVDLTTETSSGS